jgi:scyllo-inositol 2-dehydrogenase (NADP+)
VTASSDIRVATIGTSVITSALVEAARQVDGIRVDAVFSRDAQRASEAAAEYGASWSSDSLDEILASPEVDAVYIASPNSAHREQIARALAAGKHVLVEKPAVLHADEWDALVAEATASGVVLLEAMRTEYDSGFELVRSLLPRLGVLRSASLRFQRRSSRYADVLAGRRVNMFDPALGGGALNDLGVYVAHAMVSLFGVPQETEAVLVPLDSGVDGAGSILARYPGLVVDLSFSKISTSELPSEIQGEDGTLVIDHIASPRSVRHVAGDGSVEVHEIDEVPHGLGGEVRRFVALIRDGGDHRRDHELTSATLRVLEDARR